MITLKISLGMFFVRILVEPSQIMLIYITVGVNSLSSTAAFFYAIFKCGPDLNNFVFQLLRNQCTPRTLDRFMAFQQGKGDQNSFLVLRRLTVLLLAVFTTLTDLSFLIMPVFLLWNMNMNRKSKISAGFVLSLAALFVHSWYTLTAYLLTIDSGSICSIIRFQYVDGITQTEDFFWNAVNISIWSTIEAGASIIAGCLATLRPFLKCVISKARSWNYLYAWVKQISRFLHSKLPSDAEVETIEPKTRYIGAEEPVFVPYHFPSDEEVVELSLDIWQLESTEHIVAQNEEFVLEVPRAVHQNGSWQQSDRRR